ncbi:hypothetical protein LshimejAT787_0109300 [Lyophyllum shimeji]|uniref:Uncharacterized protein n=1 Tax=Lyophyllum shimeji TaxID=47721 RepID=A0A9P3UK43_LYOSH|nr:hypothetical protein LshimejAT787_0109300 [Lyophyllum shimeji]
MAAPAPPMPQKAALPIAASSPLPSTSQSLLPTAAGVSGKPVSKPASTAPIDIDPQTPAHAETLARLGIKVRDFAYESKLPPVRPFRVRQIQPGPRPLKRVRDDEDGDVFSVNPRAGEGGAGPSKKSRLEREITEPDIQQPSIHPVRERGFMNLDEYEPQSQSQSSQSQSQPLTYDSQRAESGDSQPPSRYLQSQDSEPYIDTPLVTPNGSLQWRRKSPSQASFPRLDTESLANQLLSDDQLAMPQPPDTTGTGLFGALTPMSSLSSIASDLPPSPTPKSALHRRLSTHAPKLMSPLRNSSLPRSPNKSPILSKPATPPGPTTRYQLRSRLTPKPPQPSAKPGTRNRRTMYSAAHPMSRHIGRSAQSSHARGKPPTASGSPRSRTLRRRAAGPSTEGDRSPVL